VFPFLTEMELALGAATLVVSRAGASSLAELAALRVPAILIPYPAAADNHQFHNAQAFIETGAARQLDQSQTTPELLSQVIIELLEDEAVRQKMSAALDGWNPVDAAERVATRILAFLSVEHASESRLPGRKPAEAASFRSESERP